MPEESDSDRKELIEARDRLRRQLDIVENPARSWDCNPQLVAKLRVMIDEIETALAEDELERPPHQE